MIRHWGHKGPTEPYIKDRVRVREAPGWSSREAAGERAAAGWRGWAGEAGKLLGRGRRQVLQRGCRGKGVLWCVQSAQWIVMLTLLLGGGLDVRTWV